jgi:protoheme IX farnesyltransferase
MEPSYRRRLVSIILEPKHVVRVTKLPLSLLISISAIFGLAFVNAEASAFHYGILFAGTLMVVMAGAMLNNVSDIELDKLMERTRVRPLPMGIYSPRVVKVVALILMHGGFVALAKLPNGLAVSLLSGVGLVLYNFVYTPLKTKTMWAIVPGALCGVVPPIMGWVAGEGAILSFEFALLVAILLVWQFPHFWLILLFRRADYFAARVPNFLEKCDELSLRRMLFAWLLVFALLTSLVSLSGGIAFMHTRVFIALNALAISVAAAVIVWGKSKNPRWRGLFIHLNATLGLVMLSTIVEKLFA